MWYQHHYIATKYLEDKSFRQKHWNPILRPSQLLRENKGTAKILEILTNTPGYKNNEEKAAKWMANQAAVVKKLQKRKRQFKSLAAKVVVVLKYVKLLILMTDIFSN